MAWKSYFYKHGGLSHPAGRCQQCPFPVHPADSQLQDSACASSRVSNDCTVASVHTGSQTTMPEGHPRVDTALDVPDAWWLLPQWHVFLIRREVLSVGYIDLRSRIRNIKYREPASRCELHHGVAPMEHALVKQSSCCVSCMVVVTAAGN